MPPLSPVEYAEQVLDVHGCYSTAQGYAETALTQHEVMAQAADAIRRKRDALADGEAELAITERAANAEMSATAFESHMRIAIRIDKNLRQLRSELADLQREHDWAEAQERGFRGKAEVEAGRLHELGGLLTFYGAVKIAPSLERMTSPTIQVQQGAPLT